MMNATMTQLDSLQASGEWTNWKWQQRTAIRSLEQLLQIFPRIPGDACEAIRRTQTTRRLQITPYTLTLIGRDVDGTSPLLDDPLWRQFIPYWDTEGHSSYAYDGETENWEMPAEMVTPIAQHKYDNRIIVRLSNVCHGYCQFCYEALRTLEKDSNKLMFQQEYWDATIAYLREHEEIEEVILSGGEPLMNGDEQLDVVLSDLRNLDRQIAIRIHTRALTFNPFRVTDDLVEIMRHHRLTAIGLHVTHPNEITREFCDAVDRLRRATPILFANIPLLAGVNDNTETMHMLGMMLYRAGVVPHYLYHFMPHSPGAVEFRTSVQSGIDLVRSLKRHVTNLAVPEFVLPHHSGKYSMPLLAKSEPAPQWSTDENGHPVVRYTNWRGDLVEYPDDI
jgi:lysine 2,3-aminomutase